MEQIIFDVFTNLTFNTIIIAAAALTYLFNYTVLKLKQQYKALYKQKMFFLFFLPFFNVILLTYNVLLMWSSIMGYKVVKVRSRRRRNSVSKKTA